MCCATADPGITHNLARQYQELTNVFTSPSFRHWGGATSGGFERQFALKVVALIHDVVLTIGNSGTRY
jgi:hypothetical protein